MVSSIFPFLMDIFENNKSATFGGEKYEIQSDELTVIERGCDQVKRSYKMTMKYFSTRRYVGQKHSSGEVGFSRTMVHSRRTFSDL